MQYKAVTGSQTSAMEDVTHLASEGWILHSFQCIGDLLLEDDMVVPLMTYIMQKADDVVGVDPGARSERKVLGRFIA